MLIAIIGILSSSKMWIHWRHNGPDRRCAVPVASVAPHLGKGCFAGTLQRPSAPPAAAPQSKPCSWSSYPSSSPMDQDICLLIRSPEFSDTWNISPVGNLCLVIILQLCFKANYTKKRYQIHTSLRNIIQLISFWRSINKLTHQYMISTQ